MEHDSDKQIGYGKPPAHTRWKPGQSGNPKGRPKRTKDVEKLIAMELDSTIRITERGESRAISKREALVKGVVNGALKGDKQALKIVMGFMQSSVELDGFVPDPEDRKALESFVERLSAGTVDGGDDDG